MRRRRKDCNPSSAGLPGTTPHAFTDDLLDALDEREPEPFAPDGELPGPWRVTRLWGDGPPLWAIYGLGEPGPRFTFTDDNAQSQGDLAHLAAAALAVAARPRRFRYVKGADDRLHLTFDGEPVATVHTPELEHTSLADDLTRLADLRVQPLALASFLAAVPAAVLRRAGAIFLDDLRNAR